VPALAAAIFKRVILVVILLAAWELAPRLGWVDALYLPPFSKIIGTFVEMILNGEILRHLSVSLFRSFGGYFIAIAIGIPLGLLTGWYKTMSEILSLPVEMLRNTSALALLPVFILFLGIGEESKLAIVTFGCIWPIFLNTNSAVRNVDPLLLMFSRSLGMSNLKMFLKIILPAALPSIFTGLRISSAAAVLVIIAAEMVGAKSGLGFLITSSQFNFMINKMYVGILTTMLLGIAVNYLLIGAERKFTAWKPKING
jgi:NitT/TauT family transport system permease protein